MDRNRDLRRRPSSMTYWRSREHVLGRRAWLSRDPRQAAFELVTELGLVGARRWLNDAHRAVLREGEDDVA